MANPPSQIYIYSLGAHVCGMYTGKQILRTAALVFSVSLLLACTAPLLSPTPVQARTLDLQGWGGWIVKLDSSGKYSESLSKTYVQTLVSDLASKGYNLIRCESRASFLGNSEYSKIRYPVLDLLISKALSSGITIVIDPIHDFPPETESYEVQSNYASWLAALKEVGYRYNGKSNVILECINEYKLSDAYTKFQRIVTDLRNAGITLPLHFNIMWNNVGELRPLTDPLNKVSMGHHIYGNHDDDWRKPNSGESWLTYVKRIGVETVMTHMFTSTEKLWFGYPLSQGRAVMCTEVGASIRFKYSPWNVAYVMRLLEYSAKYGVGAAVFRTGYCGDKDIYEQKAKEYFGRSLYTG
jgi:aryl-phospho-beta-D-glucosidase BglC (GH1 family)